MHKGKAFAYGAKSYSPAFYNKEYLAEMESRFPGITEELKDQSHNWWFRVFKSKNEDYYSFVMSIIDCKTNKNLAQESFCSNTLDGLRERILVPMTMFEPTRRGIIAYTGDASDEEVQDILKQWNLTAP